MDFVIADKVLITYTGSGGGIRIPEGVIRINEYAFRNCESLTGITSPASVTSIGDYAFENCDDLRSFTITGDSIVFGKNIFGSSIPFGLRDKWRSFLQYLPDESVRDYIVLQEWYALDINQQAEVFLLRHGKTILPAYEEQISALDNEEAIAEAIAGIIKKERSSETYTGAAVFMVLFHQMISDSVLRELYLLLRKDAGKAAQALELLERDPDTAYRLSWVDSAEKMVEIQLKAEWKSADELESDLVTGYGMSFRDLPTVLDNYGKALKPYVLAWLLTCHQSLSGHFFHVKYAAPGIRDEAKKVVSLLDQSSFQMALERIGTTCKKKLVLHPICRYADEKTMELFFQQKNLSFVMDFSAKYSNTEAAREYYIRNNKLNKYAELRNMTEVDYRYDDLIPDLGFDVDGVRKFQCDTVDLSVTVRPDLSLAIFDCNAQKEISVFPDVQKGTDTEQLEQLREEYRIFAEKAERFAKEWIHVLKQMQISGTAVHKEYWMKAYEHNPIVQQLSCGIVWADREKCFIPTENGFMDFRGKEYYSLHDDITAVSALGMRPQDVIEWQKYLRSHNIQQPFEQMWQEVTDLTDIYDLSGLIGLTITSPERIEYLKELKKTGINVNTDYMVGHTGRRYELSDKNTMHSGEAVVVEYTLHRDRSVTFHSFRVKKEVDHTAVDTVIQAMLKAIVESMIRNDSGEKLREDILRLFSLEQILSFMNEANDLNRTQAQTVLMNYLKEAYPEYDPLENLNLNSDSGTQES